ncbi:hypothetical protein MMC12_001815 [Toensbergia leucococca]|nr:hypothetical protein [Toensbergia leucococca]
MAGKRSPRNTRASNADHSNLDLSIRDLHAQPAIPLPTMRRQLTGLGSPSPQSLISPFLTKLPPEIRLQIYAYLLGDSVLHLVHLRHRLTHVRCASPAPLDAPLDAPHVCYPSTGGHHLYPIYIGLNPRLEIAILRTCRQIYTEAMPVLYSTNTFDMDNLDCLIYLSQTIRRTRLASIRTLNLSWMPHCVPLVTETTAASKEAPYDDQTWLHFWGIVATQMPGLVNLKLHLRPMSGEFQDEAIWLKPLFQLNGLKSFDMVIDYPPVYTGIPDTQTMLFRLSLKNQAHLTP